MILFIQTYQFIKGEYMTRRKLGKAERKSQIKASAVKLFTEFGYRKTSVQDIVDMAEFSKGGFYNLYSSKEELFRDILEDCVQYRCDNVRKIKHIATEMDRKTFLVEATLDKILDDSNYKKLFATLMIELHTDNSFYDFYKEIMKDVSAQFLDFCDEEDFVEFKSLINDEFNVFINTLILGVETFKQSGNVRYRDMLREILTAYFEKKNLFRDQ